MLRLIPVRASGIERPERKISEREVKKMASFKIDGFVTAVVGIAVAVVVFAMVLLPILGGITFGEGQENLEAIVNVIPIFVVIGILLSCIYLFIQRKA